MRRVLGVFALLVAPSLFAQTADLYFTTPFGSVSKALVGQETPLTFQLETHGPQLATNVRVHLRVQGARIIRTYGFVFACTDECFAGNFESGRRFTVYVVPDEPGAVKVTATVTSDSIDPDPTNNSASLGFEAVDAPDLFTFVRLRPTAGRPEQRNSADVEVGNLGSMAAHGVALVVDLPDGSRPLSVSGDDDFACEFEDARIVCRTDTFAMNENVTLHVAFINPPLYDGGTVVVKAHVASVEREIDTNNNYSKDEWTIAQFFKVTNTADDGPGSLREAIVSVNTRCAHHGTCVVGFRIPGPLPPSGFFTIQPESPLPPVSGATVDGTSEIDLLGGGFTRPLVMLDGSRQPSGDGLQLIGYSATTGMAIGNFRRFGVFVAADSTFGIALTDMYIGLDPTGRTAPNLRGVEVDSATSVLTLTRCVISGNVRSGVAVNAPLQVYGTRIGLAADSDAPLPNGASGIYAPGTARMLVSSDSVIAYNHDAAIALNPAQHEVGIGASIYRNGEGIDYGLDGPTPNVDDDSHRPPNTPRIAGARFDATGGKTIITVQVDSSTPPPVVDTYNHSETIIEANVYANDDADAQTQYFLGVPHLDGTVTVTGDLRGKFITATTIRARTDCFFDNCNSRVETSEISDAVPVR